MLMEDSSAMITALLVICAILQAAAVGGIMILLWALFSRVVLRDEPTAGNRRDDISSAEVEEAIAKAYTAADPWDELRIDREGISRVVQTLPGEEGDKE